MSSSEYESVESELDEGGRGDTELRRGGGYESWRGEDEEVEVEWDGVGGWVGWEVGGGELKEREES